MKRSVITAIYALENELKALSHFIYNNPELPFKEKKCSEYIIQLLKKHNFRVEENSLDIDTGFCGIIGNGHPKICYICKYCSSEEGNIYGNNINAMMNIGASIALSKVLNENISGTVMILGCPGKAGYGSELLFQKEGLLEDVDIVLSAHPYISNCESGSSLSSLPIEISFKPNKEIEYNNIYCTYDACLSTINTIKLVVQNSNDKYIIKDLSLKTISSDTVSSICLSLVIKSHTQNDCISLAEYINSHLSNLCTTLNINYSTNISQLPCDNLKTNKFLSQLFTNNEKQCGIINVKHGYQRDDMLSIGSISHIIPCIYPSIAITNDSNIQYPSKEFGIISRETFALNEGIKAAKALALTGLDIIESKSIFDKIMVSSQEN